MAGAGEAEQDGPNGDIAEDMSPETMREMAMEELIVVVNWRTQNNNMSGVTRFVMPATTGEQRNTLRATLDDLLTIFVEKEGLIDKSQIRVDANALEENSQVELNMDDGGFLVDEDGNYEYEQYELQDLRVDDNDVGVSVSNYTEVVELSVVIIADRDALLQERAGASSAPQRAGANRTENQPQRGSNPGLCFIR